MRLDVYFHFVAPDFSGVSAQLAEIKCLVNGLIQGANQMSVALDNLTTEVAEIGTVVDSAVVLITGLAAQIVALKTDPVALQALADSLDAKAGELAAAVTANTPPVEPPVEPA